MKSLHIGLSRSHKGGVGPLSLFDFYKAYGRVLRENDKPTDRRDAMLALASTLAASLPGWEAKYARAPEGEKRFCAAYVVEMAVKCQLEPPRWALEDGLSPAWRQQVLRWIERWAMPFPAWLSALPTTDGTPALG